MTLEQLFTEEAFRTVGSKDGRSESLYSDFKAAPAPTTKDEQWKYSTIQTFDFANLAPITTVFKPNALIEGECVVGHDSLPPVWSASDKLESAISAFSSNTINFKVKAGQSAKAQLSFAPRQSVAMHMAVALEPNSTLDFYEDYSTISEKLFFGCRTRFVLGEGSVLNYYSLQRFGEGVFSLVDKRFEFVGKNSTANLIQCEFGGSFSRVKVNQYFDALGTSAPIHKTVFYGSGDQHFDLTTNAYHKEKNTKSDIVVKGALNGKSSSVYRGLIKIEKGAKGTDSFLQDRVLHLHRGVCSNSIPGLMIDENDVRASHGATVSKLNDESLFYLAARGIKKTEAQRLVVEGFVNDIVSGIPQAELKEEIAQLLDQKISMQQMNELGKNYGKP